MDKPRSNRRMLTLLVCLFLFDLATKLLAYNLLPHDRKSYNINGVGAILPMFNPMSIDTADRALAFSRKPMPAMELGLLIASVALLAVIFKRAKIRLWVKWLAAFLLLLPAMHGMNRALIYNLPQFEHGIVFLLTKFLLFCAMVLFFQYTGSAWVRSGYLFFLAGAIGNITGYFYPPWRVIDFLWIVGSKLIFNFADLFVALGAAIVLLSPVYFTLRYFVRIARDPAPQSPPAAEPSPQVI